MRRSLVHVSEIGEFALIRRLTTGLWHDPTTAPVAVGDDAAVLNVGEQEQIVATTDALVEGVHFLRSTISFYALGYKSIAVSLSDVAAMGGTPRHALITLALSADTVVEDLEELYKGIDEICREHRVSVVGGDVVRSKQLMISITVLGGVKRDRAILRSGARPGDLVFVTGTVGASAAGLHLLTNPDAVPVMPDERQRLIEAHQRPRPQLAAGAILAAALTCTSCNDVSDGLASELVEISEASRCTLVIDQDRIPIDVHVRNYASKCRLNPLDWALFGGEDYQLVGTVDRMGAGRVDAQMRAAGVPFHWIGQAAAPTADGPAVWLQENGMRRKVTAGGYNHFTPPRDARPESYLPREASRDRWNC